jgi:hypothetical protein
VTGTVADRDDELHLFGAPKYDLGAAHVEPAGSVLRWLLHTVAMQPELTVRRARRDDFARVRALLGVPASASRADRKRYRRLVSTMREDLYLVERDGDASLAGLAVIAYVHGLGAGTAIVRDLRGSEEATALLLACARERAAARGCQWLEVHRDADAPSIDDGRTWADEARIHRRAVTP